MEIIITFWSGNARWSKEGSIPFFLTNLLIWAVSLAIIGAHIYYLAIEWEQYRDNPADVIAIWNGGIAIHVALIASVFYLLLFRRWRIKGLVVSS